MSKVQEKHERFVSWLHERVPLTQVNIDRASLVQMATTEGIQIPAWFTMPENRSGRGLYRIPERNLKAGGYTLVRKTLTQTEDMDTETQTFVPPINPDFVEFGAYSDIKKIIESKKWFPVYITGHSGCGKTEGIRQACAELGREFFRINITSSTDSTNLIGGMQLENGKTSFKHSPLIRAMQIGGIVVLDEWDMGTPENLACIQAIMEGQPAYIEKTGERIAPVEGFNVFATGNTLGKTDMSGRYAGTRHQNESALERFDVTILQEYPSVDVEVKILSKRFASLGLNASENSKYIRNLALFAEATRKGYIESGGTCEVITTRRLLSIAKHYSVFGDKFKAVADCVARFDDETRRAFTDLFAALQEKDEPKTAPSKTIEVTAEYVGNIGVV